MRVLHVHSGNLYGGVETMLRTMARCRAQVRCHEPVFALTHDNRIAAELRATGCEVHILGAVRARRPFSILQARERLTALVRPGAFEASIVHSAWSLALLAPAAKRPVVLYQHDTFEPANWRALWSRQTRPDLVIANSQHTAESIANFYRPAPVEVVYPCVELSRRHSPQPPRTETRTIILQAARFEAWKGHALLLDALGTLRDNPHWILWIAGSAQRLSEVALKHELHARAQRLGLAERVFFLGHITDVPSLMRSMDIYCQPNTVPEAFGITLIEALDAKVPVLATALGGANEILQPDWGVLPEPTVEAVAEALQRLIANRGLRARLGAEGPARAKQLCDPKTQIEKLEAAIRAHAGAANALPTILPMALPIADITSSSGAPIRNPLAPRTMSGAFPDRGSSITGSDSGSLADT